MSTVVISLYKRHCCLCQLPCCLKKEKLDTPRNRQSKLLLFFFLSGIEVEYKTGLASFKND